MRKDSTRNFNGGDRSRAWAWRLKFWAYKSELLVSWGPIDRGPMASSKTFETVLCSVPSKGYLGVDRTWVTLGVLSVLTLAIRCDCCPSTPDKPSPPTESPDSRSNLHERLLGKRTDIKYDALSDPS